MISFNVEEAKKGAKIVTRIGREVRIICYDRLTNGRPGVILGLVKGPSNRYETLVSYDINGKQIDNIKDFDLFLDQ